MAEFYYHQDFQDLILACMIRHPDRFVMLGSIVKPGYFTGLQSMAVCKALEDYFEKHHAYPGWEALHNLVYEQYKREDSTKGDEATAYLAKLKKIDTKDLLYVEQTIIKWARERAVINAVRETAVAIKENDWPEGGFAPIFEAAMRIGEDLTDLGYELTRDSDEIIDKITAKTYGVRTGYAELDKLWHTGWGPGWLITLLAPPKCWKTCLALNLALRMAGKIGDQPSVNVFYYSLEISSELAALRAYSSLTAWTHEEIYKSPAKFKAALKKTIVTDIGAPIVTKFFPAKTATIKDIEAHILAIGHKYQDEKTHAPLRPGIIFIDHAECVKPTATSDKSRQSDWRQQAQIYTDARELGAKFNCPLVMPDRCNRETAEQATPSLTSFQGSFEKAGIVDIGIGLCQTPEERQMEVPLANGEAFNLKVNPMRFFVFVNRHGEQPVQFEGTVCPEVMQISIDKRIEWQQPNEKRPLRVARRIGGASGE